MSQVQIQHREQHQSCRVVAVLLAATFVSLGCEGSDDNAPQTQSAVQPRRAEVAPAEASDMRPRLIGTGDLVGLWTLSYGKSRYKLQFFGDGTYSYQALIADLEPSQWQTEAGWWRMDGRNMFLQTSKATSRPYNQEAENTAEVISIEGPELMLRSRFRSAEGSADKWIREGEPEGSTAVVEPKALVGAWESQNAPWKVSLKIGPNERYQWTCSDCPDPAWREQSGTWRISSSIANKLVLHSEIMTAFLGVKNVKPDELVVLWSYGGRDTKLPYKDVELELRRVAE